MNIQVSARAGYDEEARYFEDGVRRSREAELAARAQALIATAHAAQVAHLRAQVLQRLAAALAQRAPGEGFAACAARCARALGTVS